MDIEPKRAGKCWSCRYCEDVGTYRYEDSTSYMRKCNKSGHDYVDSCSHYCDDYVWDGHTTEYWKEGTSSSSSSSFSSYSSSSSSSSYSSSSTSSGSGKGCLIVAAVIVAILVIIGIVVSVIGNSSDSKTPATDVPGNSYNSSDSTDYLNKTAIVSTRKSDLMLRSEPSAKASVVASMPKGSKVTILLEEGDWSYVEYQGKTGWCASKYLTTSN